MDEKDDRTKAEKRIDARREAKGLSNDGPRKKWGASSYGVGAVVAALLGVMFINATNAPAIGVILLVLAAAWGGIAVIATANRISRD